MTNLIRNANMSECGQYRWWLTRIWDPAGQPLAFVMLNPSTADAGQDDPTIRRCVTLAKREGYGSICVFNLYSFRERDSRRMLAADGPVGIHTDRWLSHGAGRFLKIVCAWGTKAQKERVRHVMGLIRGRAELVCLGTTVGGHPRHPVRVRGEQPLVSFGSQL